MAAENDAREAAKRVFAAELNDSTHEFKQSDGEMAPNYVLLRSGEKANRVFFIGTLTDKENVGSDSDFWRARVRDPTGTFYLSAGQYQPEAAATLQSIDSAPAYVAVVGKPDPYEGSEGDMMMSVQPESITVLHGEGDDDDAKASVEELVSRWGEEAAEATLERLQSDLPEDLEDEWEAAGYSDPTGVKEHLVAALEELGADSESKTPAEA